MLVCLRRGLSVVRQPTTRVLARPSLHRARLFLHHFAADAMGEGSSAGKDAAKGKGKGKDKAPAADSVLIARDDSYLEAVTQKRIRLFEEIQARQAAERLNIGGEVIKVTLPDGTIKEGKKWITTPMDIAKEISSGFASSVLHWSTIASYGTIINSSNHAKVEIK